VFDKHIKLIVMLILGGLGFSLGPAVAGSADFPQKPLKLVVTASAGGGEDMETRGILPYVEKYLGTSLIIENQPGAGGKIAFEKFQKTKPDGYTLIVYSFPKSIIMEYLSKTNYRTKDFTPVFFWSRTDNFVVVNSETWQTFEDLVKTAKTKTISIGIPGIGGNSHLSGLMLFDKLGIKANWVPYEAGAASFAALAGKHLDAAIGSSITTLAPLVDAGKLRLITCLSDKRDPFFPDVPTPKELGFNINLVVPLRGVEAPPHTPPALVKKLEEAFSKAAKDPGFIAWAKKNKVVLNPVNANNFRKIVDETYTVIEKVQHMLREK